MGSGDRRGREENEGGTQKRREVVKIGDLLDEFLAEQKKRSESRVDLVRNDFYRLCQMAKVKGYVFGNLRDMSTALNTDGTENLSAESDGAHRPISLIAYDNLDEPVQQQTFDGDGVAVSQSAGEVTIPSTALPTSQKVNSYDSQGRVYRTQTFSVDPTTGVVGAALAGNVFYDPDGNVLAVYATGKPTTKYLYDGADRLVAKYVTDGGAADNAASPLLTWAAAGTVVNDVVLSESDTTLDADGNAILTVGKDRLSSDAADATGVLGTTTAASRDSYLAAYYDAAGRRVAGADHGTTVISAPSDSTPSGVPTRSDSVLVTTYGYDAAGNLASVTDPRGIISQSDFDLLGNTTQTIAAFTDGVPTASTNQTTAYTYDGDGHVLTMTAVMPSGQNSQTTKYLYGVGTTIGTDLFSNDLIAKVEYPDLSTGAASPLAANDVSSTYDNLGEVLTKTDQNGSTHAYIRLNASDGRTDTSFGTDGVVTLAGTVFKISTISPSDGRLIVMGQSSGNQTVSRFSVDGVLDTTFATSGVFSANLGYLGGEASVSVQPDGKIIIARTVYGSYPTVANVRVARLNADGTLDTTFGDNGWATIHFGPSSQADVEYTLAIQADGQIIVAGGADESGNYDWALARIQGGYNRAWAQHDANFNITALADNSGKVVQRFVYTRLWSSDGVDGGVGGERGVELGVRGSGRTVRYCDWAEPLRPPGLQPQHGNVGAAGSCCIY